MSKSYSNSGPIYLTSAQYNALTTKEDGREYRIIDGDVPATETALTSHTSNKSNPHEVTASQVTHNSTNVASEIDSLETLTSTHTTQIASKISNPATKSDGQILTYNGTSSEWEASNIPQATESTLGGIKASSKTSTDTQEVKIDSSTGKLYTESNESLIDDTSTTATNKVWSVNKTNTEISSVVTNDVASEYSSSSTYSVGSYCTHENKLYKCNTAITSPESWTSSHWTQITISGEITTQNSQIEELAASASERYEGVDLTVKFADEIANYSDEWAWIKARITAHNYSGLRVHDYIPVTCSNGYVLKEEIAGFDTYKYSGSPEVGNHIDFISKDCWPDAIQWNPVNNTNGFAFIFTGDGSTTDFTCDTTATGRSSHTFTNFPYYIDRVWFGTAEQSSGWTYNRETGVLHFNTAPASGTEIVAQSCIGFFSSKVYAWLNSIKTVVPNATTADGDLLDVDYTSGGVYYYLPQKLKNVITGKNASWPTFYKKGTLLSSPDNNKWLTSLPLWLPDEMEVYGTPMFATGTYAKWFGRWYPCFFNGIRKKGSGNGASRARWWLSVPYNTTSVCYVNHYGFADTTIASNSIRCPVCFRVTA